MDAADRARGASSSEAARAAGPGYALLRAWRSLRRGSNLVGLVIVALLILSGVGASALAPADPNAQDIVQRLRPPAWQAGGTRLHVLGTDDLGRDVLSRIVYGSRVTLIVGVAAVAVSTGIGVVLGLIAGFGGGRVDAVISGLVDTWLAVPSLLIAVTIAGLLGASVLNLILVLGITRWVVYTRVTRGEVLTLRGLEFVQAARSLGAGSARVLFRHILPNVLSSVLVISTLNWAQVILTEAALDYLGLGVPPNIPTWGAMLSDGRPYLAVAWWLAVLPGVAIVCAVLGINLLGDWLRDYLDPRLRTE